jgi:hypothetical protein
MVVDLAEDLDTQNVAHSRGTYACPYSFHFFILSFLLP